MEWFLNLDNRITNSLYLQEPKSLESVIFTIASSFIYLIPVVLLVMFLRSHKERITSMKVFVSAILAWQVLSKFVGEYFYGNYGFRDRPFAERGLKEFLFERPEKAFPSDHAAVFAAITTSFFIYKYPKVVYLFFGVGLVSSLARVVIGFHWFGDVLGGWILGMAAAATVYLLDKPLTDFFEWINRKFSRKYGR